MVKSYLIINHISHSLGICPSVFYYHKTSVKIILFTLNLSFTLQVFVFFLLFNFVEHAVLQIYIFLTNITILPLLAPYSSVLTKKVFFHVFAIKQSSRLQKTGPNAAIIKYSTETIQTAGDPMVVCVFFHGIFYCVKKSKLTLNEKKLRYIQLWLLKWKPHILVCYKHFVCTTLINRLNETTTANKTLVLELPQKEWSAHCRWWLREHWRCFSPSSLDFSEVTVVHEDGNCLDFNLGLAHQSTSKREK